MDREISIEFVKRRKRKNAIKLIIVLVIFSAVFVIFSSLIKPKVNLNNFKVATADCGDIEVSFSAYGIVIPQYSEVITSPISTIITRVNFLPGDNVTEHDTLIILDIQKEKNKYVNLQYELTINKNRLLRSEQEANQKINNLRLVLKADSIKVEQLASSWRKEKQLLDIGGECQEKVDLIEMDFKIAKINRDKLIQEYKSIVQLSLLDKNTQDIELAILSDRLEQQRLLIKNSFITPKRSGVLTSVMVQPGEQINIGQQIATIADISKFKIVGTVPGKYANRLNYNQKVNVYIQDSLIIGIISGIAPEIKNESVNFTVTLDNPSSNFLRAQLKTDVRIIQSLKQNVIRLPFENYYQEDSFVEMFVVNGDVLEKRKVLLGGCSYNFVEVISGISIGEKVILNKELADSYKNYKSIGFKN